MKAVCNSEKLGKGEFSKSGQDSPLCREGGALVTQSCLTLATPWTVTCQAPLSVGVSRQEYWSELPFPPPGVFPIQGIEPSSLASPALAGGFFYHCATSKGSP